MTTQELDRLAATEIMKWAVFDLSVDNGYSVAPCPKIIQNVLGEWIYFGTDGNTMKWSPTIDEAHAALVREKMRADGREITLTAYSGGDTAQISKGDIHLTVAEEVGRMCYALVAVCLLAVGAVKERDLHG